MLKEEDLMSLTVDNLTKGFGPQPVLDQVNFFIRRGECRAILGDSGCGKTTLLKTLAGFYYPDAGEIRMGEKTISRPDWVLLPPRRRMAMVFQSSALWPHMTVEENIAFGIKDPKKKRGKVEESAESLRISSLLKRYPHQISGGQARRVALARALAADPAYLLLDEPFTNLDASVKEEIMSYLKDFVTKAQVGVILVTHQEEEARFLAQVIYEMKDGKLTEGKRP